MGIGEVVAVKAIEALPSHSMMLENTLLAKSNFLGLEKRELYCRWVFFFLVDWVDR